MTKQEAKELTLEVWRYLAEHPEIAKKSDLPSCLRTRINNLLNWCPLCEFYYSFCGSHCSKCPLKHCMTGSCYDRWCYADRYVSTDKNEKTIRKEAAMGIVDAVQAWKPEASHDA